MCVHEYARDSAVFMYKDLLNCPIPAGDMAATCRDREIGNKSILNTCFCQYCSLEMPNLAIWPKLFVNIVSHKEEQIVLLTILICHYNEWDMHKCIKHRRIFVGN